MKLKYGPSMDGKTLTLARKSIGLLPKSMSQLLSAPSLIEYKRWEKDGLRVPHDIEGPTTRIVEIILYEKVSKDVKLDMLRLMRYPGPEKIYKDVKLVLPISILRKVAKK